MKYFARFHANTRARFATWKQLQDGEHPVWKVNFADKPLLSMVVYDRARRERDFNFPHGLGFDLQLEAESMETAISSAHRALDRILTLISFVNHVKPANLYFDLCYEAGEPMGERRLRGDLILETPISSRPTDQSILSTCVKALDMLTLPKEVSPASQQKKARIDRAMDWLRKGLAEDHFVDEFAAYWIGLESIDPLLRPIQRVYQTCPHCGEAIDVCNHCGVQIPKKMREVDPLHGIVWLLSEQRAFPKDELKRIRRLRGAFIHGGKTIGREETKLLMDSLPELRKGLAHGIALCLGVPEDVLHAIVTQELVRSNMPLVWKISAMVTIPELPNIDQIDREPRIEYSVREIKYSLKDENRVEVNPLIDLRFVNCTTVAGKPIDAELFGDRHAGIAEAAGSLGPTNTPPKP